MEVQSHHHFEAYLADRRQSSWSGVYRHCPNLVWASDITYICTDEGWLYCNAHRDLFNGEIVGYALGSRMTQDLIIQSLSMAVARKKPNPGLIHHSDRGKQHCSQDYQTLIHQFHMKVSMRRKGNCYDNAPFESFWGMLKNELISHERHTTREQAIREMTNILRSSTTDNGYRPNWGIFPRLFMKNSTIEKDMQH